jgi:hypothetical protein
MKNPSCSARSESDGFSLRLAIMHNKTCTGDRTKGKMPSMPFIRATNVIMDLLTMLLIMPGLASQARINQVAPKKDI